MFLTEMFEDEFERSSDQGRIVVQHQTYQHSQELSTACSIHFWKLHAALWGGEWCGLWGCFRRVGWFVGVFKGGGVICGGFLGWWGGL